MSKLMDWMPFKFRKGDDSTRVPVQNQQLGEALSRPMPTNQRDVGLRPFEMMRQMDDLFESLWSVPMTSSGSGLGWFGGFSAAAFAPRLDVSDEGEHLVVSADLPDLEADDVRVSVVDGCLTLQGEKRREDASREKGYYRIERAHSHFRRTIPLPSDVASDQAEATFSEGVLTIRIPKSESTPPEVRQIPIAT